MFASPPEVETAVFAEVPPALRPALGARRNWGGVARDSFLEGPVVMPSGELFCVNVPYGQILRIGPDGAVELEVEYDGEPNGLTVRPDGVFFICDYRRGLMRYARGGPVTEVVARYRAEHFKGINDLAYARNGDLYFTDQGESGHQDPSGRVFRLTADGRLDVVLGGIPSPNGLALTDEDRTLLVAVTRANAIWRVPLTPDGGIGRVGTFLQLSGGIGPDGMAVAADGRIAVAHLGLGSIWVFDRFGEPLHRVRSCRGRAVTNVAFAGEQECILYITEADSGCILKAVLPA